LREVEYPRTFGINDIVGQSELFFQPETRVIVARQPNTTLTTLSVA
jgi:hypothetical protein